MRLLFSIFQEQKLPNQAITLLVKVVLMKVVEIMVKQSQAIENNTAKECKDRQKDRAKAAFSLLDHFIKAYNNAETYIKRGLTLFGLGSIIAGASFSLVGGKPRSLSEG